MKIRRIVGSAVAVFALAVAQLGVVAPVSAAGGVATWTGGGSDNKFSTAANWSGNALPTTGDVLTFNTVPVVAENEFKQELDNDLNVVYGGIKTLKPTGNNPSTPDFQLKKTIKLQGGATWDWHSDLLLRAAKIEVAGDFAPKSRVYASELVVSGKMTVKSGLYSTSPLTAGSLVVENGATFAGLVASKNLVVNYPVTLGGGAGSAKPVIDATGGVGSVGDKAKSNTVTFAHVTLKNNAEVWLVHPNVVEVKKLTKNGFKLTRASGATGTLKLPDGVQEQKKTTSTISGNKPDKYESVVAKETATLKNATRDTITVSEAGTLKGNGTVKTLFVHGTVAPGNSPGKITVLNQLQLSSGATYQAEVLNKSAYDQLVIRSSATQVEITGAELNVRFLAGGKVNRGETFRIIDNQSSVPVTGTFRGLAEGARVAVGNVTFAISYKGGTGNDVVLTALNTAVAPGVANTGFHIDRANPGVVAAVGVMAVVALALIARRQLQK